MKQLIAFCGLDCEKCDAYQATLRDDQKLREETARRWSEWNKVLITPEQINCQGCRADGVKTVFCESLCAIRQCALQKNVASCGDCAEMETCPKLAMITGNNADALRNLRERA